jgi:hypothetical protein
MRRAFLFLPILLLFSSCGGGEEEEKKEPTVVPGASEKTHTKETVIENPMDSTLMAEYMALTKGMKSTDSLKYQLDKLAINNDSLMQLILAIQDSIDVNLPVRFPSPDTTDYNIPPHGDLKEQAYFLFDIMIPEKGKELKTLPKELIGTYAKPDKAQITISKTDIIYTSRKGKKMKIFNISSDQKCTISDNYYLLQYKVEDNWVVVSLELKSGNLSYRIIPEAAKLNTKPTKKVLKKYLTETRRSLLQVYVKVK